MIQRNDLLTFNYYKKEKFTGSNQGMRYLIQKDKEWEEDVLLAVTWPGPYNYAATPEEMKTKRAFPFREESLEEIAEYLNQTYEQMFGGCQET